MYVSKIKNYFWFLSLALLFGSNSVLFASNNNLLTPTEQFWLLEHKERIRLAPNPNYPPVAFVKNRQFKGITADYIELIEKNLGIQFKRVYLSSWSAMLEAGRNREIDIIGAIQKTTERETYLNFTEPYLNIPNAIIVRADHVDSIEPNNLDGLKVAIVKGYATHRYMQKNYPNVELLPTIDNSTAIQMVAFGSADVMISDLAVASYIIEELGVNNLQVIGFIDFTWELAFASHKNLPELQSILQKAIDAIPLDKRENIKRKWINMKGVDHEGSEGKATYLFYLVAGISILSILVLIWNYSLKSKIRKNTNTLAIEHSEKAQVESALEASKEKYQQLIANMPDLLYQTDAEGRITYISPSVERLSGYTPEEAIGLKMAEAVYLIPKEREDLIRALQTQGSVRNFEAQLKRKDGSIWWGSANAHVLIGEDNTFLGVEGVVRDITDLRQSEQALRESEARFLSVLAQVDDVIWIANPDTEITYISNACEPIYGYPPEQFKANPDLWKEVIHPDDIDRVMAEGRALIEDGYLRQQYRILHADGSVHWLDDRKHIVFDPSGEITRMGGIARDITERKVAEKALRRAQKMDAVGQLTGGIAHDFNNILGIILGNISLLKPLIQHQSDIAKRVSTIEKSAERAANLTKQLLGFSRRQATQVVVTDLNHLIREMDSLITRALTPKIKVEQQLANDLWSTEIDAGDFQDSLLNLIINARDAMPMGGSLLLTTQNICLDNNDILENPEIEPGEYIRFTIEDSGEGISSTNFERIFEPFFTTKPQGKGTGLGLAMVFGFVSRSHGHIKVMSDYGKGTQFRLLLPRAKEITSEPAVITNQSSALKGNELILAVDDEVELLEFACQSLESLGYRVITASDAHKALDVLTIEPNVKLLFSDILMPGGINGYELAEQAKTLYPSIKILLTTGYTEQMDNQNLQQANTEALLRKPYSQVDLAKHVRTLLESS